MRMSVFGEQLEAVLLLFGIAEDADKNDCRFYVAGDVHIVDGDQADFVDVKLAADGLANLALEQFAHPLDSETGHVR